MLTVKDNSANSAGTITINGGSVAGTVPSTLTPSSNNTFTAGEKIEIETDGGSDGSNAKVDITLVFTIT